MAGTPSIGIIGGGIVGCAIAFELADRGVSVTLFDARPLGGGATHASAGILAPYIEAHPAGALADLAVRGLDEYVGFVPRVRARSGVAFEYRRCGTLEIAETDARVTELQQRLSAPWAGAAGLQWLDARALRDAAPPVSPRALGALACAAHGYVAVPQFTAALAQGATAAGATIHACRAVDRLDPRPDAAIVHTAEGSESFDRVVLCAGAWTPLIDPLGHTHGRIRPVRGQLVRLSAPTLSIGSILWGEDCYIVPWSDGTVLVGATSEDVGYDERATVEGVGGLLAAAMAMVPALASAAFVEVRVGLRPAAGEGVPIVGAADDPRVLYAAGHFRNGVLLAPLTARLIADLI